MRIVWQSIPLLPMLLLVACDTATPEERAIIEQAAADEAALVAEVQAQCESGNADACAALYQYRQGKAAEAQAAIDDRRRRQGTALMAAGHQLSNMSTGYGAVGGPGPRW